MAVNILLGAPGGGKSYEAVAFHVLPALAAGRKVITNLPLNLEALEAIDPSYPALIDIRTQTRRERPEVDWQKAETMFKKFGIAAQQVRYNPRPFSYLEDYGDPWRHPENGTGPLYIIDECHLSIPTRGTPIDVEEWYSLHRHEFADVLLISQSHGKINRAIIDLVQICYRVRKNTALGSEKTYRRLVFDGVRERTEVNFSVRKYDPKYFALYRSHTKSEGKGQEQASADITPIWKRPIFVLAGISILISIYMVSQASNPISPKLKKTESVTAQTVAGGSTSTVKPNAQTAPASASVPVSRLHALSEWNIHQIGELRMGAQTVMYYRLSKQGRPFFDLDSKQLVSMGYEVAFLGKCFSQIDHPSGWQVFATCDSPSQGVGLPVPASGEGPVTSENPEPASATPAV